MSSVKRFGYRDKELHLMCKGGFLEGGISERYLFLTIPFRVVEVLPYWNGVNGIDKSSCILRNEKWLYRVIVVDELVDEEECNTADTL